MTTLIAPIPDHTVLRTAPPLVHGRSFILVRDDLWRIVDPAGAVIGYIERLDGIEGERFSARRIVFATRSRELGVFCRLDDAVDCFR